MDKIVVYATGGAVPELVFGPILIYVGLMVTTCLALAGLHHRSWKRAGKRSAILRTESRPATKAVDRVLSVGVGVHEAHAQVEPRVGSDDGEGPQPRVAQGGHRF